MVSKQMKKGKYKLSGMDSTEGVTLQFVQGARCTNVNTFVFFPHCLPALRGEKPRNSAL